ncbi:MAG: sugar phosphate isomerase/epimerase [Clostridia bacterium]|nr:sugar phosphate isomerase/epimerase [Clostridia bacterium]
MRSVLCMGLSPTLSLTCEKQIRALAAVGFDGFFTAFDEKTAVYRALADELGMLYQSIHAPIDYVAAMWQGGEMAEKGVRALTACAEACAQNGIPTMVAHTYMGFEKNGGPTAIGIENYRRVVERAADLGVKVALENTEGEEYLAALMRALADYDNLGFCLDTGHEFCYNKGQDMLALYGDRLLATHINDNLGVSSPDGGISPKDDLHLLPFDGRVDMLSAAQRLVKCGYKGPLTFEIKRNRIEGRRENDGYFAMSPEAFLNEAHGRALRFCALVDGK